MIEKAAGSERLVGKVCMVTGATNGHGRAVAGALARMGAELVIVGRSRNRCRQVQAEIAGQTGSEPGYLVCDLGSRSAIDRAADEFLDSGRPLHVLVNNAGVVNRRRRETEDGVEEVLAVNYLAYFHLTLRMVQRLLDSAPARIVNVASDAHRIARLDLVDLEHRRKYSWWSSYARSKLAVVHFTRELATRLNGTRVTVNAVDPGPVASNIAMNNRGLIVPLAGLMIRHLFPSPEKAAMTAVYLASDPEVEGISGRYYKYGRRRSPRLDNRDPQLGKKLWDMSVDMTGVDFTPAG